MAGIYSQRSGKYFEKQIEIICGYLRSRKIANIIKLPVEKIQNRYGKMIYVKKSTVDFIGYYYNNGRFICFDVKNRPEAVNSWTFGNNKQQHQIQYLYEAYNAGTEAFLLIRINGNKLVKVRPDETWNSADAVKIIFDEHKIYNFDKWDKFLN